jgi:hypothetical protein
MLTRLHCAPLFQEAAGRAHFFSLKDYHLGISVCEPLSLVVLQLLREKQHGMDRPD